MVIDQSDQKELVIVTVAEQIGVKILQFVMKI